MWQLVSIDFGGRAPALTFERGMGFWLFVTFSYGLILYGSLIVVHSLHKAQGIFRKQLFIVLIGICFPWISNVFYVIEIDVLNHMDLTPIAFSLSGLVFLLGLMRYQKLSIIPLAQETINESLEDPVIAIDMDDRILDINKAGLKLFRINHFIPAHYQLEKKLPDLYQVINVQNTLNPREIEISLDVEKQIRQWNLRLTPLKNYKGKQIGWLIILRDITDKKEAESALKESERIHRIMLETSPNPIVYYNSIGEVSYLNPAFTRVFGWHLDEVFGKRIDFVPDKKKEETKQALKKTFANPDGNHDFITQRYTKKRELLDVSINSAIHQSADGLSTSTVVNFADITKIKQTEQELRNSKNFIRSIINSMPSLLIGVDDKGRITQWNTEAEKLTGVAALDAEGGALEELFPQILPYLNLMDIVENKAIRKTSKVVLNIAGKEILTDITVYPIVSENERGVVIRVDDIQDRVKIEEMMVQSEKMLSVGGLAAGMAHEINNPLAGMLQNIQVIKNRLTGKLAANINAAKECDVDLDNLKSYMEKRKIFFMMDSVTSSGFRAAKIVENMLSFSRKSDQEKFENNPVDIMDTAIDLVSNDYRMKKQFDFKSIKIIKDYPEKPLQFPCSKNELQQVFLNILKNGAEAMMDSHVNDPKLYIRISKKRDQVVFEIKDNGPGIEKEIKKRIFEPFFTTKDVGLGTGLGLSVSYFIITENHNGTLLVESSENEGSTFIVSLPISLPV